MLTSQQNVPRIVFMQISAAIIEKSIFYYNLASIGDNRQNNMYRPMLCWHDHMCLWQFNMQISAAII